MTLQDLRGMYIDHVLYSTGSKLLLLVSKNKGNFVLAAKNAPDKSRGFALIYKIKNVHFLKKATIRSVKSNPGETKTYGTTPFNFSEYYLRTNKGTACIYVGLSHGNEGEYPNLYCTQICRKDDLDIEEAEDDICLLPGGYSLEDEDHG